MKRKRPSKPPEPAVQPTTDGGTPHRDRILLSALGIAVFASRLPFVHAGYGRDPDAWRLIRSGHFLATTGTYEASRLPGYPLPEFFYAVTASLPQLWILTVVLLSTASAVIFALIIKRLGSRDYLVAAIALAFTPIVYINSTNTMDYLWALAFALGAFWAVLFPRVFAAGILIGVAAACRITSAAMLVPMTLLLLQHRHPEPLAVRHTLKLWLTAAATIVVAYTPVFIQHGAGMLTFVDEPAEWGDVFHLVSSGVWGSVGTIAVAVAIIGLMLRPVFASRYRAAIPKTIGRHHPTAWITTIVIYVLAFLRLPGESGYLIIIVPFVLLVFARFLPRPLFVAVCLLIVASSFLDVRRTGIFPGAIMQNNYARDVYLDDSHTILRSIDKLGKNDIVVIAGWLAVQLETLRLLEYPHETYSVKFTKELETEDATSGREIFIVPVPDLYPLDAVPGWRRAGAEMLPIR